MTVDGETSGVAEPTAGPPRNATVSRQMSRMPRKNTKPEVLLRRELHRRGMRFRVHLSTLPGKPDLALTRARLAVFIDGCFWHACPEHGTLPRNNREWWRAKLDGNVRRDRDKDSALQDLGWHPLHVWEHTPVTQAADEIQGLWRHYVTHMPPAKPSVD
ncbi:very short patch repair endonuclease [Saccharomonospora iraqiensis]|uniref:very short patch repair endonuclease n=1 Tax=Saccharomonospora iraqiensis TaxID=52698 RepID=UPI000A02C9F0|nr:very short patch repair endonuclease [Saccharomonospora iraqiensis]